MKATIACAPSEDVAKAITGSDKSMKDKSKMFSAGAKNKPMNMKKKKSMFSKG